MIQRIVKVNKQKNGKYCSINDASIQDIGGVKIASTICARYWKGYASHGYNVVLEILDDGKN